jgi:hypothetical protein
MSDYSNTQLQVSACWIIMFLWHHDTQYNNIQYNDIQYNDIQHNDIQHNIK